MDYKVLITVKEWKNHEILEEKELKINGRKINGQTVKKILVNNYPELNGIPVVKLSDCWFTAHPTTRRYFRVTVT